MSSSREKDLTQTFLPDEMSRSAAKILSTLEEIFINAPTAENSVLTVDGNIVRIDRELWEASPVLREHSSAGSTTAFKRVTVSKACVIDLVRVHRKGIFPTKFSTLLDLHAATAQLGLEGLQSRCFDEIALLEEKYSEVDYPSECSSEVVLEFFGALIKSPMRTISAYADQLTRIATHCNNDRAVMTKAVSLLKETIEDFDRLDLHCIPADFSERLVPVAIVKRHGKLETMAFLQFQWQSIELLGKHCNLESLPIENFFYLKYGSYLLYKANGSVFRKNLRDGSDPQKILEHCTIFLTRGKFVFAVVKTDRGYSVLQWSDDSYFMEIHSSGSMIHFIEFNCESRLLAIQDTSNALVVFMLGKPMPLYREKHDEMRKLVGFRFENDRIQILQRDDTYPCTEDLVLVHELVQKLDYLEKRHYTVQKLSSRRPITMGRSEFVIEEHKISFVYRKSEPLITLCVEKAPVLSELFMSF